MMDNSNSLFISLFEGNHVRLATRDPEKDAEIESRWTHDPGYLRSIQASAEVPRSLSYIRKRYEEEEKDKERDQFVFGIHAGADDRLIGFVRLRGIQWSHGTAMLTMAIGDPSDRGRGYGTEASRSSFVHWPMTERSDSSGWEASSGRTAMRLFGLALASVWIGGKGMERMHCAC